jgi:uncharacterized membrane protein
MTRLINLLFWIGAVGCGVIAGLYFAFSTFIMTALDRAGPVPGTLAMNSINVTILQSLFMPLFWVTTAVSLVLAVVGFAHGREPGGMLVAIAGLIYFLGMFGVTMFYNVPLNNALAAADPATADGVAMWGRYMKEWTLWNHVRTVTSLAASILFMVAIRGRLLAQ